MVISFPERREILMGNILSVQKVQKYYGNKASLTRALDVISFDVEQGEFNAL